MTPKLIVAIVLAVAVLLAWGRLILWRRGAGGADASPTWRLPVLMVLQPVCAALLFFSLFPPPTTTPGEELVILTAGAAGGPAVGRRIALPEANASADIERAPDLGTVLRRNPDVGRITVVGAGLTPRDIEAAAAVAVRYAPGPIRPGLIALAPPAATAPGAAFAVGGQVHGAPNATVDLLDPVGRVTDSAKVDADGGFVLQGTARAAGAVTFALRVRDATGRQIEQVNMPVQVRQATRPRLLILAGAPSAEVKYLRRWATDAGFDVTAEVSLGAGLQVGDPAVSMDAASLRRFDAVIIDERRWDGLGGGRSAVLAAVREGLGLVVRAGGPLDGAAAGQWRALGFSLNGPGGSTPLVLPPPTTAEIARTRRGVGSKDRPLDPEFSADVLPEISRLGLTPAGAETAALLHDGGGAVLSAWRPAGRGRIAVFTGLNSYGLTLTGRRELYGDWWGAMLGVVARPEATVVPPSTLAWAGERSVLCGLADGATLTAPDGQATNLQVVDGCASAWPDQAGWHALAPGGEGAARAIYIQPAAALPTLRAARDRDATVMLTGREARASTGSVPAPGSPWPWLAGWLLATTGLWWFERARRAAPNA